MSPRSLRKRRAAPPHDHDHDGAKSEPDDLYCQDSPTHHEYDDVSRPSLYVHEPRPRRAPFEQYYGDTLHNVKIMEELKSDRLEGVYNLSFLLLAFALAYLFIRNVVEMGFLAGPSAICFAILLRDLRVLFTFIIPLPCPFSVSLLLVLLHARRKISTRAVVCLHSLTLTLLFTAATYALLKLALNPLFGVAAGVVVVIVALKMHSYVMTNLLLCEETEQRRSRRVARRSRRSRPVESPQTSKVPSPPTMHMPPHHDIPSPDKPHVPADTANSSGVSTSSGSDGTPTESTTTVDTTAAVTTPNGYTSGHANRVAYPRNVTLPNLCYFIIAPTLVYETGYPRTERIRATYIMWYGLQACLCGAFQYVLLMQFCVPVWRTATPSDLLLWFSLKLALPCFFSWLLLFWGLFHCMLNVVAEVTRFADREFYREWWNATDLSQFWRMWNMPVHEWCVRHLFVESVSRQRMRARTAALGTFLLSAVLHEYVCVVGFRLFRPYMFAGMMLQVPLIKWSTTWVGTRRGNCFMWIMLFFGQSWVPLLYCRDYLLANGTLMCRP